MTILAFSSTYSDDPFVLSWQLETLKLMAMDILKVCA